MKNSITNKINDYVLAKVAKGRAQHLFAVSKKRLFTMIHDLNEKVEELQAGKEYLNKTINQLKKENSILKTHIEAHADINYKLAYESLRNQNESLIEENKGIKDTLKIVSDVVENTKKQNNLLKEQVKIISTQNERLTEENKVVKHNFTAKRNTNANRMNLKNS